MLPEKLEYNKKIIIEAHTLNGKSKDVLHKIIFYMGDIKIELGVLYNFNKKKNGEDNYLFTPHNNPAEVKTLLAENLSDALSKLFNN